MVIWTSDIEEKDINDMIISGLTNVEITDIIHRNTFSGLQQKHNYHIGKRFRREPCRNNLQWSRCHFLKHQQNT